tara:strand:- start:21635 stop:23674 length:2040 start_codon:yes stop_codon:yes gene_type:complete
MNKIITHWAMALITLVVLTFVGLEDPYVKQILRLKSFDLYQQYEDKNFSQDIGVVTIDEASIEKYGQWPWKRDVLVDIIIKLRQSQVGIIVIPILFAEPDRMGGDEVFAQTIQQMGVVIAQVGTTQINKNSVPRGVAKIGDPLPYLFEWPGMLGPIPELGQIADGVGVINTAPEIDGVVRRIPLIMRVGEETYPAMALETIRVATGDPSYQIKAGPAGVQAVRVPGFSTIETDAHARIWLRWNKEYETISASSDDFSAFAGRTVVLGVTAEGLASVIATPTGEQYDYVLSASTLQTVIDGKQLTRYDISHMFELLIALAVGVIVVLMARFTPYWAVGVSMLILYVAGVYGAFYLFKQHLMLVDVSWILITITFVGMHSIFNRFVLEFRLKQQIRKQFEHYLAPSMVAQLQKNPSLLKLGGDTRRLTMLFSDLRGFTSLSEKYKDTPQELTNILNRYMTRMLNIVTANEGTVDKLIGDAVMAFWNAPLDVKEQEVKAVKTAIQMEHELKLLNNELKREKLPQLAIGIGINTGDVVVGNMGSDTRFDYTVIGDAVNLAARLEGQSKTYGVLVVFGEETRDAFPDSELNKCVPIDKIRVKGKNEPIDIYTYDENPKVHQVMNAMLTAYRQADWKTATARLKDMSVLWPKYQTLINLYLERIKHYKKNPPNKDWDGSFTALTK